MRDWLLSKSEKLEYILAIVLFLIIMLGHQQANCNPNTRATMVDSVRNEISVMEIQHSDIVLKQAIWESGWFECKSCSRRFNNIFGFRHASWITEGNPLGYIKFDTWQASVAYYKRWQDKYYSSGDYYAFLTKIGYAEDQGYINNLKSIHV